MSLDQVLAWISPGSPEEALARTVNFDQLPAHVAIIMDGNGRWAAQRHLPRVEGHRAGIDSVRDVVETSARLGIGVLTLYAFSVENWKRPRTEINVLMMLLKRYIRSELGTLNKNNIRFRVIGRPEELAPDVQRVAGPDADDAGRQQRGDHHRKRRDAEIAGRGEHDQLADAEHDQHRGEDLKHGVGGEPHHADGDRDQGGTAEDAGHRLADS